MASNTDHKNERAPGPGGRERLRLLWEFFTDVRSPSEVLDSRELARYREQYGSVVRIASLVGDDVYLLTDPHQVEYVFETNGDNFRKAESRLQDLRTLFGDGLLTASGDDVTRHRRSIASLVSPRNLDSIEDAVVEQTKARGEQWASADDGTELHEDLIGLVTNVLGRIIFGPDYENYQDEIEESFQLFERAMPREYSPIPTGPDWLPTPHNRTVKRARASYDDAISEIIAERRRGEVDRDDVLQAMLTAETVDLSDAELRDQTRTILIAGLVTAPVLARSLYALSRKPDEFEKLRASIPEELGSRDVNGETDELSYCERVIDETLRLYPPVPPAIREAIEDDVIGGYRIPAGSKLIMNQLPIHRNPVLWDDPLAFRPERFAGDWADSKPKYSYFPFSGGIRTCIGRELAREMLKIALAVLVADYDFELRDESANGEHVPFESQTFVMNVERRR